MWKVTLLTMGNKMPAWVCEAVLDYSKRLSPHMNLHLIEIPLILRGKSHDNARILEKEALQMLNAIPHQAYVIALDLKGQVFSSEQLAKKLEHIQHMAPHVCFLIGGPEGLSPLVLARTQAQWSLSALTLPHTLARIMLLETLYRSLSILNHHPYHK